jgi:hypothetical protein
MQAAAAAAMSCVHHQHSLLLLQLILLERAIDVAMRPEKMQSKIQLELLLLLRLQSLLLWQQQQLLLWVQPVLQLLPVITIAYVRPGLWLKLQWVSS